MINRELEYFISQLTIGEKLDLINSVGVDVHLERGVINKEIKFRFVQDYAGKMVIQILYDNFVVHAFSQRESLAIFMRKVNSILRNDKISSIGI
jgi:hypothetical protein